MEEVKDISPWAAALMTAGGNILANNRPGVSYGSAIGSGISSFAPAFYATKGAQDRQKYIDTLQKYKQLEFDAEQQKAQRTEEQRQRFRQGIESGAALQGMPETLQKATLQAYQLGGVELAQKVAESGLTREPNKPTEFEYFLNPETRAAMLAYKRAGATTVSNDIRLPDNVQIGKIDPGYLLRRQGDSMWMEPIPGSKADLEIKEGVEKKEGRQAQKEATGNIVIQEIDRALDKIENSKLPVTGAGGALMSNVPGTDAYDLGQLTETIKANTAFDRLDQMRQNSPTGGALGAVSDAERAALAATKGSLDLRQSEPQLKENLKRLRVQTDNYINGTPEQRKALGGGDQPKKEQKQRFVFDPATGELVPK